MKRNRARKACKGFTLVELLVVIALITLLAAMLLPVLAGAQQSVRTIQCANNMRQIGHAALLYSDDNNDTLPRSQHSAFAHGELPWERSIASQLGLATSAWTNRVGGVFRCPDDKRVGSLSYGFNVFYELGPEDDYTGKPETWRHLAQVPHPSATILFAENAGSVDHLMAHFWITPSDASDLAARRHRQLANYSFTDGHVNLQPMTRVFSPPQLNLWNPTAAH